jgi:hypothetical protein
MRRDSGCCWLRTVVSGRVHNTAELHVHLKSKVDDQVR